VLYFINVDTSGDVYVQISYNKAVVFQEKIDKETDITVDIRSKNQILSVVVKDNNNNEILNASTINIESNKGIENTIHITEDFILMIHANCHTKQCMYMKITKNFPSPIICTNGITVELKYDDVYDYIHLI